jgi:hypothetical protein
MAFEQLLGFDRPRHQFRVEADPVGAEVVPEGALRQRVVEAVQHGVLEGRILEEISSGARQHDAPAPVGDAA